MIVVTENGNIYKVITTAKNPETGKVEMVVNVNGLPKILTEPVKRLIFETIMEIIKNAFLKLFKIKQ